LTLKLERKLINKNFSGVLMLEDIIDSHQINDSYSFCCGNYNLGSTDLLTTNTINQALNQTYGYLSDLKNNSELAEKLELAFGNNYNPQVVDQLITDFAQENLTNLPSVEVVSNQIINGANAAYDTLNTRIYLSQEFILANQNNLDPITGVLLEEFGHFIDSRINESDALGDEGEIFAALVQGRDLSTFELAQMKTDDDTATIFLDGQEILIEQNNTLSTAYYIGTLSGTRSFNDYVGSSDTNDYYKFYISNTSNFSLTLSGMSADGDVQLLNSSGAVIQTSSNGGSTTDSITRTLNAGYYYARVYPYGGANTNYNLSLTANPADIAGNTLSTANYLGTLSGTRSFNDYVGSSDTNDYYKFYISNTSNFSLTLSGMSADGDVQLLNSSGAVIQTSSNGGSTTDSITRTLNAGYYYARVYPYGGANTNYNLSLTANPADIAGNTLSTANYLGTLSGTRSFNDYVGSSDTNDYYKFYISNTSNFSLTLSGMSADGDVQLLDSAGNVIQTSSNGGSTTDSITRTLNAGYYYARVYPYGGANTNYNLSLTATAITTDLAGNSLASAYYMGTLNGTQTYNDSVSTTDTNDYYCFYVDSISNFELDLWGMSADADVQLLDSDGYVIDSSTYGGTTNDYISYTLDEGYYYVRVYPYSSASTNYTLSLATY
jgi:hypothetical protein